MLLLCSLCACGASTSASTSAYTSESSNGMDSVYSEDNTSALAKVSEYDDIDTGSVSATLDSSTDLGEDAKIIYTASLTIQTTEFDDALDALKNLVSQENGYFESSSLNNYSTYRSGSYTIRIPSEQYNSFCDQAGEIGQTVSFVENSENISETYYDTKSRLETQETKLKRLQELLGRAETMDDIITIEDAISTTEEEIESLNGTLRYYDLQVGYSTVTISLEEVYQLGNENEPAIGFGARFKKAIQNGFTGFVNMVQFIVILLAYLLPYLCILLIVAGILFAVFFVRRKKQQKRSETGEKDTEEHVVKESEKKENKIG